MNLRAVLFASAALSAGHAYAQDACVATDPSTCTDANTVEFCNAELVTETFDCSTAGASCGDIGCSGPSAECTDGVLFSDCVAPVGGRCIGLGPQVNTDTTDDAAAFALSCEGDATCVTGPNAAGDDVADACVAHLGAACSVDSEAECAGQVLVFCRRFIENEGDTEASIAQDSNIGLDCGALGGTCNSNFTFDDGTTGPNCEFPDVAEGEGEEGEGEDDDGGNGGNGRDDEPEAAPKAGCFNAYGTIPALAPLALVLVALRRRRRA